MVNFFKGKRKESKLIPFKTIDSSLTVQERGSYAKALLENPVFKEIMEELRRDAIYLWEQTSADAVEQREFYWKHIKALNQIEGRVTRYANEALYQSVMERQAQ